MTKQAKVLFANEVTEQAELKSFSEKSSGTFQTLFIEESVQVIVKEITEADQALDKVRMIAGDISRTLKNQTQKEAVVTQAGLVKAFSSLEADQVVVAFVEGWHLGAYEFDKYKSKKAHEKVALVFAADADVAKEVTIGETRAAATAFSRDLMNEIPSTLTPESFPTFLQEEFTDSAVNVVVHDKEELEKMEMNGLLAVNRGSKFDPAFIELHYEGDTTKPLVALVGKGVTFDTGGISLKSGRDLSDMRMDMGGAAAVAGAIKLLAESNAQVNVVALIQTVENMPGSQAILPGDIITYKNGKTVQVGNTDAEGRLILADGLIRAGELNAEYVVDIATLTGAIVGALGPRLGGIFGDESLMARMKQIGEQNGEFVWPMPLVEDYDATLKSDYADFSNISNQASGGSITAGLFLRRFVADTSKWIHVDMAGVMDSKAKGYHSDAGTGFGARLLADYTEHISE